VQRVRPVSPYSSLFVLPLTLPHPGSNRRGRGWISKQLSYSYVNGFRGQVTAELMASGAPVVLAGDYGERVVVASGQHVGLLSGRIERIMNLAASVLTRYQDHSECQATDLQKWAA
jgi:hypothetical protein